MKHLGALGVRWISQNTDNDRYASIDEIAIDD